RAASTAAWSARPSSWSRVTGSPASILSTGTFGWARSSSWSCWRCPAESWAASLASPDRGRAPVSGAPVRRGSRPREHARARDARLDKRFGSLVVARGIELALPPGARHALIGPNGAGKTTLINMITGMLEPDGGQVFLGGQEVTRLGPDQRVKRGLTRTFQINALFPRLSPLEATTLAVCERTGLAAAWRRPIGACRAEADEAYGILRSLGLDGVCRRPTRELPYGQQRLLEIGLALATRPRVLLLDEPAAGVPRNESAQLFTA